MNQPSQHQGNQNTFASQPAAQTNPFTADLKGEFSSNFGTNTNAVSQIFKEGGFGGNNRSKYYLVGLLVVILAAAGFYYYTSEPSVETPVTDVKKEETKEEAATAEDAEATDDATASEDAAAAQTPAQTAQAPTGAIALSSPANGASLGYDETQGSATFTWQGQGGTIIFSRSSSMKPEVMRVNVTGTSFSMTHPWPGKWFWKVENASGASEVRSFSVSNPVRRNIALTAPAAGASLAGTGGEVSWQGDSGVAYYRVELSQDNNWANPQFKFASSGSKLQINGVPAGAYSMRLGAFSEVSGRWEFTQPVQVTVQ